MSELERLRDKINITDKKMAQLFCERMTYAKKIAEYKKQNGLSVFDKKREEELLLKNLEHIDLDELKPLYSEFFKNCVDISKKYQSELIGDFSFFCGKCGIVLKRGSLKNIENYCNLKRKVFIVTDDGVPMEYVKSVVDKCLKPHIYVIPKGEKSKCIKIYSDLLSKMLSLGFDRSDCVVAVGGGVVGDIAGFVAATYMRGIDFYNVPTTVLSQVDSSIGGKVAVNLDSMKNSVGAFYSPKAVIIDPDTLKTLDKRQISNGLAESVKMSLTLDAKLFELFETDDIYSKIDTVIEKSLIIKKRIVEADEKENGLRRVLNFGHTLAHAVESENSGLLLHGECVALGMIPMCSKDVRKRLINVLKKLNLPYEYSLNVEKILSNIYHDKKITGESITVITVDTVGEYNMKKVSVKDYCDFLRGELG